VTELCQFLGGDRKIIIAVEQHSQPLLTIRNRGGGLFCQKSHPSYSGEVQKRQKSGFLKNSKIPDCEPAIAARELKKGVNVRT
jgi:hypothetical protein